MSKRKKPKAPVRRIDDYLTGVTTGSFLVMTAAVFSDEGLTVAGRTSVFVFAAANVAIGVRAAMDFVRMRRHAAVGSEVESD